jgi:PTS system nitrogen regulatory IIA component
MKISNFLTLKAINVNLQSTGKLDVLAELGQLLASDDTDIEESAIVTALIERERLATTGIGNGIAIPHAKIDGLSRLKGALGISQTGIPFDAVDEKPVHVFVALLAPRGATEEHLKALAKISRLLKNEALWTKLLTTKSKEELFHAIIEADEKV